MARDHAHIVRGMRDAPRTARPVPPPSAPVEPGARRSLRALLRGGPVAKAVARADLRLYRLLRTAARPPAPRADRPLLAPGRARRRMDRARPCRRRVRRRAPTTLAPRARQRRRHVPAEHRDQGHLPAGAAGVRRPPGAHRDADRAELPERARLVVVRRGAGVLRARCRPARSTRGGRDGRVARLPRRALPDGHRGGRGARDDRGSAADEGRHRRAAQRGQVLAVQRADPRGRRGGELPVHDDRAERRGRARSRTSAWTPSRGRSGRRSIVPDTIDFHDIAGLVAGASKGEGLGNQFLANIRETDAIVHVVRAHHDANVIHPEGDVDPLRDIYTIDTELIYADLEQAERRLDRVVRQARGGDRAVVAEERWLRAGRGRPAVRAPGPHGAGRPRTRPTRCATCTR